MNDYRLSVAIHQEFILGNAPPTGNLAFDYRVFTDQTLAFLKVLLNIWPATILIVCDGNPDDVEAKLNQMKIRFDEIIVVNDGDSLKGRLAQHQIAYHFGHQAFASDAILPLMSSGPEQ